MEDWLLEKQTEENPEGKRFTLDVVLPEYVEFLDKIGIDKCFVVGHSAGTMFAQGIGALLHKQGRLLGLGLLGGMPPPYHSKLQVDKFDQVMTEVSGSMKKQKVMMSGLDRRGRCCFFGGYTVMG